MTTVQMEPVNSRYGAPMGRHSVGHLDTARRSVRLFQVPLDSGGYDNGGAYWGHGGGLLYCARDRDGNQQFTRAGSRTEAAYNLDIPAPSLIVPGPWRAWGRRVLEAGRGDLIDLDNVRGWLRECLIVENEK